MTTNEGAAAVEAAKFALANGLLAFRKLTVDSDLQEIVDFRMWITRETANAYQAGPKDGKRMGPVPRDVKLDLQVLSRRADRLMGQAIRLRQSDGRMFTTADKESKKGTKDTLASYGLTHHDVLTAHGTSPGIYSVTDGVTDEEFEAALVKARELGNVTRTNVFRILTHVEIPTGNRPADRRWRELRIVELANTGMTSEQIAKQVGIVERVVRHIAKEQNITITGDKVMDRSFRGIDPNRIVQETAAMLDGLLSGISMVKVEDLDQARTKEWTVSMTRSLRALNRFNNKIKETVQ